MRSLRVQGVEWLALGPRTSCLVSLFLDWIQTFPPFIWLFHWQEDALGDVVSCTWGCGQSCLTLCDPMDYNPPGCSVHGFPRQEYWSGLPCSSPRDLPDPGMEPTSLMSPALAGRFFTTSALGDNEMTRKYENLTFSQEKQQENPWQDKVLETLQEALPENPILKAHWTKECLLLQTQKVEVTYKRTTNCWICVFVHKY